MTANDFNWHVAFVSRTGLERLARIGLHGRGFDVHVPTEYGPLETKGKKHIVAGRFLISPYFYVRFHTHDREEHAAVLEQRGVKHVLLARGRESEDEAAWFPSPIQNRVVRQSIAREYEEQHNATKKHNRDDDHGLTIGQEYRILRGHGEGKVAFLIAVDRGEAKLAFGTVLLKKSIYDIAAATLPEKKRAA